MARNTEYGAELQIRVITVKGRCSQKREGRHLKRDKWDNLVLPLTDHSNGLSVGATQAERQGSASLKGLREELGHLLISFLSADSEEERSRALRIFEQTLKKYICLARVDR